MQVLNEKEVVRNKDGEIVSERPTDRAVEMAWWYAKHKSNCEFFEKVQ